LFHIDELVGIISCNFRYFHWVGFGEGACGKFNINMRSFSLVKPIYIAHVKTQFYPAVHLRVLHTMGIQRHKP